METKWTKEQQQVIDLRGCNMLVSAAAGSGKTAVLVERILAKVLDVKKPVDIDRLLVVTFTKAAAAQMRERIRISLEKRLEEEPDNVHLQRQMTLVHHAQIMTIDSFCLDVVRNHFHTISLDPGFRIGDEGELGLLRHDVMDQLLEEAYQEDDADFLRFSESFSTGKTDQGLEDVILQLYDFSMGYPWPQQWRSSCAKAYFQEDFEELERSEWMKYLMEMMEKRLADFDHQILLAKEIADMPDGPYMYQEILDDAQDKLRRLSGCHTYREYREVFEQLGSWKAASRKKDPAVSDQKKELVKDLRDQVKNDLKTLQESYFSADERDLLEDIRANGPLVNKLCKLAERFAQKFAEQKTDKMLLDFYDLEHFALQILVTQEEDGWKPTAVAKEYAEHFDEVMIDEYQDSNLVQEILLTSVSREAFLSSVPPNRFMVGDVKQSIYRFRLARPELFMEKYHTYTKNEGANRRIDLHKNFRSRHQVLDLVNLVFRQIMTESLGDVEYDSEAALYPGAVFEEGGSEEFLIPEVILVDPDATGSRDHAHPSDTTDHTGTKNSISASDLYVNETEENGETNDPAALGERQLEAAAAAGRIREIVGKEPVWDAELGEYRPARYSDIVVLLRTVSGWVEPFAEVFANMGIPVYTGGSTGYFSALEVRTVLSYLDVLDNPRQDIPLASALRSPIGNLSDEELARLRIYSRGQKFSGRDSQIGASGREMDFYHCCLKNLERNEIPQPSEVRKLRRFWKQMEHFRERVPYTPVHLLLWEILDETGYGNYVTAMPGGAQRKANLDMLVEKAVAYESTSYQGLFHFVRYIEKLQKYEIDYGEANLSGELADVVHIMSIHKSKGLEFPIVVVSGLGKSFNNQDSRSRLAIHPRFGVGCDYIDPESRLRWPLLIRKVIGQKIKEENLGEELRILYVAMTRAKEKLILTGLLKKPEDQMKKWSQEGRRSQEKLSYTALSGAGSYLDWVMPALLRHESGVGLLRQFELPDPLASPVTRAPGFCLMKVTDHMAQWEQERTQEADVLRKREKVQHLDEDIVYDEEICKHMKSLSSWNYPWQVAGVHGKMSVSELKKMSYEGIAEDAHALLEEPDIIPLLPRFRRQEEGTSGAAIGTVYHSFMENLDFTSEFHENFAQMQLETLTKCGKILKDESQWISLEKINTFLKSELAGRMQKAARAGKLFKEQPFVLGIPANQAVPEWDPKEEILIQGIIDAYFYEEDEIVLLDYKTDRVQKAEELVKRYKAQLDYYQIALERLTGNRVKERLIYSLYLGDTIIL